MGVTKLNFDLYELKEHPLRVPEKGILLLRQFGNENIEKYKQNYPNTIHLNKTIRF